MNIRVDAPNLKDGNRKDLKRPPKRFVVEYGYALDAARQIMSMIDVLETYAASEDASMQSAEDGLYVLRHFSGNVASHIRLMYECSGYDKVLPSESEGADDPGV